MSGIEQIKNPDYIEQMEGLIGNFEKESNRMYPGIINEINSLHGNISLIGYDIEAIDALNKAIISARDNENDQIKFKTAIEKMKMAFKLVKTQLEEDSQLKKRVNATLTFFYNIGLVGSFKYLQCHSIQSVDASDVELVKDINQRMKELVTLIQGEKSQSSTGLEQVTAI